MTASDVAPQIDDAPRLGRKRDHSRDPEILEAALDVLAEEGYDGMTVDMVAARAKAGKATLYRRWPSKPDLVVDAVACMKSRDLDLDALPDTGTLRGDLIAMIKVHNIDEATRKMKIMTGLVSMITRSPEFAEAARAAVVEPRAAANRILLERAVARGEVSTDVDVDVLAHVGPALVAYRVLMLGEPITRDFLISNIDEVILPAAGIRPTHA